MNKQAFKNRMRQLKQYREQNPGKTYFDFMEQLANAKANEWQIDEDMALVEMLNDNTYNYKQMYYDNPSMSPQQGHFVDTYKTVYHPTFSVESMYSGNKSQYNPEGLTGGTWDYNNQIFHLGKGQNRKVTQQYLNQEDPGWKAYSAGGEIPPVNKPIIPDEPIPYKGKLYKDRYGKKYTEQQMYDYYENSTDEIDRFTGRPMNRGLKDVMDIEDAISITPIGDAIAAYDIYDAARNKDWKGAGLAAMSLIPFVPMTVKQFRSSYRGTKPKIKRPTPKVNKDATQKAIDQYMEQIRRNKMSEYDYLSDVANESNRIFESINTVPYRSRAIAADKTFGTNYNSTYDILDDMYEQDYFNLPAISGEDMGNVTARMQANEKATNRFITTRQGATPRDFEFKVNVNRRGAPDELATHELNHYTDYAISKHSNTAVNNNMLQQLEKSLKDVGPTTIDSRRKYLRSGTEQKAYMNTLRRRMLNDGTIKNIDDQVSTKLLYSYIDKLPDSDYIKKAYKEHKNISSYAKWFNSIPLLGIGALSMYKYMDTDK